MKIEFVAAAQLSEAQQNAIEQVSAVAYSPVPLAPPPSIAYQWASPQWSILLWDQGELVTHVGLTVREIRHNGEPKRIGGVGGVMTAPSHQGRGWASQGLRVAAGSLQSELAVAYALLFCLPELVPFYGRFGWQPFQGKIFIEQPNQHKINFSAQGAMLLNLQAQAPLDGELDLQGLPW